MFKKAVLATIVYYDVLEYPLTGFEVWKHLILPREALTAGPTLGETSLALDALIQSGTVSLFRGFAVLPGRESLVPSRIHDEKRAVGKIKRAARLIRSLAWVPFVRMIGLTGSLSMKQGDEHSDWDLFIVLRKGAIWRGRTALSLVLQLIGKRRHGRAIENRACLNHFVTDGSLEISLQDFFSAHEYRFMYPIVGEDTFRHFELANRWMADIKPAFFPTELPVFWMGRPSRFQRWIQERLEALSSWHSLEAWLSEWQKPRIINNPKSRMPGAFIVATDEALIFLPHPKGPIVFERFKEKLSTASFSP
jgi:hypothetical protein